MSQLKLTDEIKKELLEMKPILRTSNRGYSSIEQDKIYSLFNRVFGQAKAPNGCGACLRSTITSLKKALQIVETV